MTAGLDALRQALEIADELADVARELVAVADLVRREVEAAEDAVIAADESRCQAAWGACPDHGATLTATGGRCWCHVPGCGRTWDHDRLGRHCTEPAAYLVADPPGRRLRLCAGHWITAQRIDGIRVIATLPDGRGVL